MGHQLLLLHEEVEQHLAGIVECLLNLFHICPLFECVDDLFGYRTCDIMTTFSDHI
ncbi:hypothetical protein I79_020656 [Cricetulus griseus]|uniref:Uncharacterized protein n=1 Tax=Cricetulus griseus TaxID=10029 RepID=G3IAN0_CRIGR|nr:hypothetical protein I79_020656 [Cricetulus griseus]